MLRNKKGTFIIAMLLVGAVTVAAAVLSRGTEYASKNNNLTIREVVADIKY